MINYSKTKIYKIYSHLGDKIYIGSTTKDYLSQRMSKHRDCYLQWKKGKGTFTTSYTIFEEYGIENCLIELLDAKPCISIEEQRQLEGKYIRDNICVNKIVAGRSKKGYEEDNPNRKKIYYEANKDKVKAYIKQYNEANKDKVKAYKKQYYEANKVKI